MNKKGFTIAETLVTFVLVAFIGLTLLQLLLNYKDLATVKIKQQTYAAIKDEITRRIQKDVREKKLRYITQESENSISFVYEEVPSDPVRLTVHSISYTGLTGKPGYDELEEKYIEYDGVKYKIPSGLPEYENGSNMDYTKYQSVNFNMGNIYYQAEPIEIKLSNGGTKFQTIYHVVVSIGVTDLDEDYGLDMVFVADGKGTNYERRNLIDNSSFESNEFYITAPNDEITYKDIEASTNATNILRDGEKHLDGPQSLHFECPASQKCTVTLSQKVNITDKNSFYTLSYYYMTNYGSSSPISTIGISAICCSNTECKECNGEGTSGFTEVNNAHAQVKKCTGVPKPDRQDNTKCKDGKEWERFQYTFKPNPDTSYIKLMFGVYSRTDHASKIYIDAIQLEKGITVSRYQRT